MQLRRLAAIAVMGAALTTVAVPATAPAASAASAVPSFGVWRASFDDNGFTTGFWWWPY